jgi:hypothetical protein
VLYAIRYQVDLGIVCRTNIEIQAGADVVDGYQLIPGGAPSSAATPTLPAEKDVSSNKDVVFYRDTNGWCPFCQKVCQTCTSDGPCSPLGRISW